MAVGYLLGLMSMSTKGSPGFDSSLRILGTGYFLRCFKSFGLTNLPALGWLPND